MLFWSIWGALLVLIFYQLIMGGIVKKFSIYEFPLLLSLMFLYFYIFHAYFTVTTLGYMFDEWMLVFTQSMVLFSFILFLFGWRVGNTKKHYNSTRVIKLNYNKMWSYGVIATLIATISLHMFELERDFTNSSAYWYMLYHIGYPGLLACLIAIMNDEKYNKIFYKISLLIMSVGLIYIFILSARRGPIFPLVIFLSYGFGLLYRRKPKKLLLIVSIGIVGIAMLIFPHVRDYQQGGTQAWSDKVISNLSLEQVTVEKSSQAGDNEYFYHVATMATTYEYGSYQYGTGYLSLFLHWIPRSMWPDKPSLGKGFFNENKQDDVVNLLNIRMSSGASSAGVSESFSELGFLSIFLWMFIGYIMGRLYAARNNIFNLSIYVSLISASHWLVAQGFVAAFVPATIYVIISVLIVKLSIIK